MNRNPSTNILTFAATVELGAGLVVAIAPALAIALLLGVQGSSADIVLGRCFGIAIFALGVACWPVRQRNGGTPPGLRALLVYNALVALCLGYAATSEHLHAPLLWPAIALHGSMALLLVWAWRVGRS